MGGNDSSLLSPDEALARVCGNAVRATPRRVAVADALGLTVAEEVPADRDAPPFDRAMMDGFAVHSADAGRTVRLLGEIAAGDDSAAVATTPLEAGTAVRIMTGARVPVGADALVPVEEVASTEGDALPLPSVIEAERHIARQGCETRAGAVVVQRGDSVTPLVAATLAGVGRNSVEVYPSPRLAILATGNELDDTSDSSTTTATIRDTNSPMLAALARSVGVHDPICMQVGDTLAALGEALAKCEEASHVLLTGGVSAGAYDLVPEALAAWGATPLFHKVSQKPGKPLLVATRTSTATEQPQLIFGLPGNPLAAHLGFQRYVAPALRIHMGKPPQPQRQQATLTAQVKGDRTRTTFALLTLQCDAAESSWHATPIKLRGSADLYSAAKANAMLRVEPGETIPEGETILADWLVGSLSGIGT